MAKEMEMDTEDTFSGDMHDCGYDQEGLPTKPGGEPETKRAYPTLRIESDEEIPTEAGEHSYVIVAQRVEKAERDGSKVEESGRAPYSCELEVRAIKPLGGVEDDEEDEGAEDKGDSTSKLEDAASGMAAGKQTHMSASQIRKMMSSGGMESSVEE